MTLKPTAETLAASTAPRENETVWAAFPKEFEKSLADVLDRRFTIILILTILLDCLSIAYFMATASRQMSEEGADHFRKIAAELERRQAELEREAKFVDAPLPPELPPENSTRARSSAGAGRRVTSVSGTRESDSPEDNENSYAHSVSPGSRSRENISTAASRAGILGLLTNNNSEATGRKAKDVLEQNNAQMANLDEALANADPLRHGSAEPSRNGGSGGEAREIRGGRSTNIGGIDAHVRGLDKGKAQDVQRSGALEVGMAEPLIEEPTDDGKATGSRDRDAVAAVVTRHNSAIQFCYQKEVRRTPNLKGKLVIRFVIAPQGNIASVNIISSTLNNPAVESCILERIKRWDDFGAIDPAKGNTTFRQVYTFGY